MAVLRAAGKAAVGIVPAAQLARLGLPALVAGGVLAVLVLGAGCWVIASDARRPGGPGPGSLARERRHPGYPGPGPTRRGQKPRLAMAAAAAVTRPARRG